MMDCGEAESAAESRGIQDSNLGAARVIDWTVTGEVGPCMEAALYE